MRSLKCWVNGYQLATLTKLYILLCCTLFLICKIQVFFIFQTDNMTEQARPTKNMSTSRLLSSLYNTSQLGCLNRNLNNG